MQGPRSQGESLSAGFRLTFDAEASTFWGGPCLVCTRPSDELVGALRERDSGLTQAVRHAEEAGGAAYAGGVGGIAGYIVRQAAIRGEAQPIDE